MPRSERRKQVIRSIREARKRRGLQRDLHAERVAGSLVELQEEIRASLRAMPSEFEAARLEMLLRQVDAQLLSWSRKAKGLMSDAIEGAWELGPDLVNAPFRALGADLPNILLPPSLLDELVAEGVELMDGVGTVARKRIHGSLERGLLGGISPQQVMQEISTDLRAPGPFRYVAFRAEAVTRTEMGRVHSKAGDRRLRDAVEHVPGLAKQWIWSGKGRSSHASANHQVRAVGEPYDVGGERLQFPRDPAGSPGNTVFCACESVPYLDRW